MQCCCVCVCAESNPGKSLLDGLPLLHPGKVVVVQRHVGHDGLFIRMSDHDVIHLQKLHDTELPLCQSERMLQITLGVIAMETVVVKKVRSGMDRHMYVYSVRSNLSFHLSF